MSARTRRITVVVGILAVTTFAATGVAGSVRVAPTAPTAPTAQPVESTRLVCPAPLGVKAKVTTSINAVVGGVPDLPARSASVVPPEDTAVVAALSKTSARPLLTLDSIGSAGQLSVSESLGPVLVSGNGQFAPGLAADQLTRGADGPRRGLAATPCSAAGTDFWFVGGGTGVGRSSTLLLTNTDNDPAQVDVLIDGPAGPVDATTGRGIVVAGRSRVAVALAGLAPAQPFLAIHAVVRLGRVSAALLDNEVNGLLPQGIEYVAPTEPERTVVVPGVLAGRQARDLFLLAPGTDTIATISGISADGTFVLPGLERVQLGVDQVRRVSLVEALAGRASSLIVTADRPIVVGVRMNFGTKYADFADTAGAPALDGPAVATGLATDRTHRLTFTAPKAAASVTVSVYNGSTASEPEQITVAIPEASARTITVAPPAGSTWGWVLVEPDLKTGPVYASRATLEAGTRGVLATSTTLRALRVSTEVPSVASLVGSVGFG